MSKFYKKMERKNIIHYEYFKCKYGYKGKCIFDKKKLSMIMNCDNSIEYDTINYNKFNEDYKAKNLGQYNMKYKKYQEYHLKSLFLNNDILQNIDSYKKFKDQLKLPL